MIVPVKPAVSIEVFKRRCVSILAATNEPFSPG